jgi:lipopolysaccharide export LptBFGC system permease protein LptF
MFIIILAAFIFVSFALSQRYDRDMITVVPVTTVILVFILYILAFFRALGAIDIIAAGVLVLLIFFFSEMIKMNERRSYQILLRRLHDRR